MGGSLDKDLPSPNVRGRVMIHIAKAQHGIKQWFKTKKPSWLVLSGWRATVTAGTGVTFFVLVANVVVLSWGMSKPTHPRTGMKVLSEDCSSSHKILILSHLLINALSTVLLGISNMAMQCLSAPTRKAIDKAHAKGYSLDIGISSLRNWSYMDRWRQICWILLVISSLPLHLLYNSAVLETTSANKFFLFAVTPGFLIDDAKSWLPLASNLTQYCTPDIPLNVSQGSPYEDTVKTLLDLSVAADHDSLRNISGHDCKSIYHADLLNSYSNGLIITAESFNSTVLGGVYQDPAQDQVVQEVENQKPPLEEKWILNRMNFHITLPSCRSGQKAEVAYCLLQETLPHCSVQLIPSILGVVLVCNTIKLVCFAFAARMRNFRPVMTLGDGLDSFLRRPDQHTRGLGPLSAADVRRAEARVQTNRILATYLDGTIYRPQSLETSMRTLRQDSRPWDSNNPRWYSGASEARWFLTYAFMAVIWITSCSFFVVILVEFYHGGQSNDLGQISLQRVIKGTEEISLYGNIILANSAQLLLSLTYISFNGLLTCIAISLEFTKLASRRSGLRVTHPTGYQHSSYFLSLPYGFSIPLLILSGALHWALSQSLFVIELTMFQANGDLDLEAGQSYLGVSKTGVTIFFVLITVMVMTPLALGMLRYSSDAPLVESSSIAISAACHTVVIGCIEESQQLLKYGVIGGAGVGKSRVGLSSGFVTKMEPGEHYNHREPVAPNILDPVSPMVLPQTLLQNLLRLALISTTLERIVVITYDLVRSVWDGSALYSELVFVVLIPVFMSFYLVRAIAEIVRWKKRWNSRIFYWHVLPEILLLAMWSLVIGVQCTRYNKEYMNEPPTLFIVLTILTSVLAVAGELFLWWQQHPVKLLLWRRTSRSITGNIPLQAQMIEREHAELNDE